MLYVYFCSFINSKGMGFGRCEYNTDKPITSVDSVEKMEELIKVGNKFDGVSVINFQLLKEEQENESV